MADNRYCIDYGKREAGCKKCKQKIEKGVLRIAKIVANAFSDEGGDMKMWFHVPCIFEQLSRARATTKKIEDPGDLDGWDIVEPDDRKIVMTHIKDSEKKKAQPSKKTPPSSNKKSPSVSKINIKTPKNINNNLDISEEPSTSKTTPKNENISESKPISKLAGKDNDFREFRRLCASISDVSSYLEKTKIISIFFKKGTSGTFKGDLHLWVKMLLPGVAKQVYNLQSKQLIKLFSQLFDASQDGMLEDLEQGDIAETVRVFFELSKKCGPAKKSNLTIHDVDNYLKELSSVTKEDDHLRILKKIASRCTGNDLKMIVRLIKHDLRINSGPKHVLEALHPTAYEAFQASRNLEDVIDRILESKDSKNDDNIFKVKASLMTPVLPMLAEACKSIDYAFKKCPNGMYAELKYDGERVQVHKQGNSFKYFSRSLKPVLDHKVQHLKEFIPKAFEFGNDLILDSEVLLIDTKTQKPLPFGTLGKHKKEAFTGASVCLFVFDCLHYNGENLMSKSITERRKTLNKIMKEVPNHVVLSELTEINNTVELKDMIQSVISQGLEGLVLKDKQGKYEPGKRHWLKMKKDYLEEGAIADTADLVVLGAYFGTGNKGGMMSIFLMGCYNEFARKWCTVTKVHGGHDDATLEKLQKELDMTKISRDVSKIPDWLDIKKPLVPDFICNNPKKSQVWEITGAEFSKAEIHTASGISIRFPRVTRIRNDKTWKEATTLDELKKLYENSKQTSEYLGMKKSKENVVKRLRDDQDESSNTSIDTTPQKKIKLSPSTPSTSSPINSTSSKDTKNFKPKVLEFNSPDIDVKKHSKKSDLRTDVFPNVFTNVSLHIPKTVKDYEILLRYFIAYDGDYLQTYEIDKATHIIYNENTSNEDNPDQAVIVTIAWLWDSIKKQKRMPETKYSPS